MKRADLERLDNGPVSFDADEELSRTQLARLVAEKDGEIARLQDLVTKFQSGGKTRLGNDANPIGRIHDR